MKRSPLPVLAAVAVSVVVTLGVTPSAGAVGHREATTPTSSAEERLSAYIRQVARLGRAKHTALVRAARTVERAQLPLGEAEILASISRDRDAVAALGAAAARTTRLAEARDLGAQIRKVRPLVYTLVAHRLLRAARLLNRTAAAGALINDVAAEAEGLDEALDVGALRAALDAAALHNNTAAAEADLAVDEALLLTAFSPRWVRANLTDSIADAMVNLATAKTHLEVAIAALETHQAAAPVG